MKLPSINEVTNIIYGQGLNKYININKILQKLKLNKVNQFFSKCSVLNCKNEDIKVYYIWQLEKKNSFKNNIIYIFTVNTKVRRVDAMLSILEKKFLVFCKKHYQKFEKGILFFIDTIFLNNLLSVKMLNIWKLKKIFKTVQYNMKSFKQK